MSPHSLLAGMVSLLNDARLAAGRPPMGFLNPFLYQNAAAFLDIVHGGNVGFDATVGYDPASGLGTFGPTTFQQLLDAALKPSASSGHTAAGDVATPAAAAMDAFIPASVAAATDAAAPVEEEADDVMAAQLLLGLSYGPFATIALESMFHR